MIEMARSWLTESRPDPASVRSRASNRQPRFYPLFHAATPSPSQLDRVQAGMINHGPAWRWANRQRLALKGGQGAGFLANGDPWGPSASPCFFVPSMENGNRTLDFVRLRCSIGCTLGNDRIDDARERRSRIDGYATRWKVCFRAMKFGNQLAFGWFATPFRFGSLTKPAV